MRSDGPPPCTSVCEAPCQREGEVLRIAATEAGETVLAGGTSPELHVAHMTENSAVISQPNVVSLQFRANVALPRLTEITVSKVWPQYPVTLDACLAFVCAGCNCAPVCAHIMRLVAQLPKSQRA
jgi:hypothetical protein